MSFIRDMIMLNAKDYLGTVSDIYVNVIIFAIAIALCIASFVINHHKACTYKIIRQLLRRGATSEENAKTLKELHLDNSKSIKSALKRKGQLASVIKRAGYTPPTYEEYLAELKAKKRRKDDGDFEGARFYVPKDKIDTAKRMQEKGEPTILRTVLVCVLIFALSVCAMLLMPEILTLLAKAQDKI